MHATGVANQRLHLTGIGGPGSLFVGTRTRVSRAVAVLDGGWDRRDPREDPDAPRRLYYVAMTRAQQTLVLSRFDGPNPMQDALIDHLSVAHPEAVTPSAAFPELLYRQVRPSLQDVDLGFAGRRKKRHPIHRAISALTSGDRLETRITDRGRWLLLDADGTVVGRLAKGFRPPTGMRCRAASVVAVVAWNRKDTDPKFHDSIRRDAWEVVVPELVFEPR